MRRNRLIFCYALAVVLEALALKALLGYGFWPKLLTWELVGFHGAGMIVGTLAFYKNFPTSYQQVHTTFLMLVLGFCAPLPLFGLLFLGLFRYMLSLEPYGHPEKNYYFGTRQVLTEAPLGHNAQGKPQSIMEILHSRNNDARRKAILSLRSVDTKKAVRVLQKAILDSDDQVRFLAQTEYNSIIARLENTIKAMEAELAQGPRDALKLVQLAEHYHEMVYLELSNEEMGLLHLRRAMELLKEALQRNDTLVPARFLLLKCALRLQDVPTAKASIERLKGDGIRREILMAWEMELLYLDRNWEALRRTMEELQSQKTTDSRLQKQIDFWLNPTKATAL